MIRIIQKRPQAFQKGLSLVELMVALVLGLFVVGSLIGLYINTKETYLMTENMSRLQENGRIALNMMSRDIRWTDYRACVNNPLLPNALAGGSVSSGGGGGTEPGPGKPGDPISRQVIGQSGSDFITTRHQSNSCVQAQAIVTTDYRLKKNKSGLSYLARNDVEAVEGIQDLQVLYGEDTDNDFVPNYYVAWGSVVNAQQVVAVRLTVTAETPDAIRAANNTRVTRDFTSTVVLRNRVP